MSNEKESVDDISSQSLEDKLKIYLKIKPPFGSDKNYYNISEDKKTLSILYDTTKEKTNKTLKSPMSPIELDKIFDYLDENSYIYEDIMRDCITESLEGENFTFVCYGSSNSNKHHLIIGKPDSYDNITTRGLFPRFLEGYLKKINSNEGLSNVITIYLSYFIINNNNLIDLSQLIGKNDLEQLTENELFKKYSKELSNNNNYNLLRNIKKNICENEKDSLFFLTRILNIFDKLEVNSSHILSWSYFNIIVYITDNNGKTISTITFIIMPGNEIIFQNDKLQQSNKNKSSAKLPKKTQINNPNNNSNINNEKLIKNTLNEFNYSVNDLIKIFNTISGTKFNSQSKLFSILGNLSFDLGSENKNKIRKYRIIGSMYGNSLYFNESKNTLTFLSECKKTINRNLNKNTKEGIKKEKKYSEDLEKTIRIINRLMEKIKNKDEQIYDLESKVSSQESKLNEINNILDSQDANSLALQYNYKKQIETLKQLFGFTGDINNLLKDKKESEEFLYTKFIRNTTEENNIKTKKIDELKKEISQLECENQRLKNLLQIKHNDLTMVEIIKSIRLAKNAKSSEINTNNIHGKIIEELTKKNSNLQKQINILKNEIQFKKNILTNLPEFLTKIPNYSKSSEKSNKTNNDDDIQKIMKLNETENKNLIGKYESILNTKKKDILSQNDYYNNIDLNFKNEKEKYYNELIGLFKILLSLITSHKKLFLEDVSVFYKKNILLEIVNKEEEKINPMNYPILYKYIEKKENIITHKKSKSNTFTNNKLFLLKSEKSDNKKGKKLYDNEDNENKQRMNNIIQIIKTNIEMKEKVYSLDEMWEEKFKLFKYIPKKKEQQLFYMSEEELQQYIRRSLNRVKDIESYINKYFKFKNGKINKFNVEEEQISEIKDKIKICQKQINELIEKSKKLKLIMEQKDKLLQEAQCENYDLKQKLVRFNIINTDYKDNFSPKIRNKSKCNDSKNSMSLHKKYNTFDNYNKDIYNSTNRANKSKRKIANMKELFTLHDNIDCSLQNTVNSNTMFSTPVCKNNHDFNRIRPISTFNKYNPYFQITG